MLVKSNVLRDQESCRLKYLLALETCGNCFKRVVRAEPNLEWSEDKMKGKWRGRNEERVHTTPKRKVNENVGATRGLKHERLSTYKMLVGRPDLGGRRWVCLKRKELTEISVKSEGNRNQRLKRWWRDGTSILPWGKKPRRECEVPIWWLLNFCVTQEAKLYSENKRGGVSVGRMEEGERGRQCQGFEGTRRTEPVIVVGGGARVNPRNGHCWAVLTSHFKMWPGTYRSSYQPCWGICSIQSVGASREMADGYQLPRRWILLARYS